MSAILRRRMAHSKKQIDTPYIADGLAFWLDGINKGADNGDWLDLIDGMLWANNGAESTANGFYYNGSVFHRADDCPDFDQDHCTIEICAEIQSLGVYPYLFRSGSKGQCGLFFGLRSGQILFMVDYRGIGKTSYAHGLSGITTVSANTNCGVYNFAPMTKKTQVYNVQPDYGFIGKSPSRASGLVGTMHSIRIYNRLLTEEEMIFNQQIDNERFNLGLA